MYLEKPLPSDTEAEQVSLGAVLLDNTIMSHLAERLKENDFYSPLHRRIFAAMLELFEKGAPIDPILIGDVLKREGSLNSIGGVTAITNLSFGLPHFDNVDHYINIIRRKSLARQLVTICNLTTNAVLAEEDEIEEVFDMHEGLLYDTRSQETGGMSKIGVLANQVATELNEQRDGTIKITGISTGYEELDDKMDGLQKTDLIIVAARPSMGKTALALNIACNVAFDNAHQFVVGIFSLEMSKKQLAKRIMTAEARIDAVRFKRGHILQNEAEKLNAVIAQLQDVGIEIDDTAYMSAIEIKAKARRLQAQRKGLDLIVIDYLQLMKGHKKTESRQQEVSEISRQLKAMAKELDVPVIAISQLSRAPELRKPPRPIMSDLRESGSIEQDADIVAFLYREDYYNENTENKGEAEIIIAKNRNGPTGTAKLAFVKHLTRFENLFRG